MCNLEIDLKALKEKIDTYNGNDVIILNVNEDFEGNIISLEVDIGYVKYILNLNNGYVYENGTSMKIIKDIKTLLKENNIDFKKRKTLLEKEDNDIFIF